MITYREHWFALLQLSALPSSCWCTHPSATLKLVRHLCPRTILPRKARQRRQLCPDTDPLGTARTTEQKQYQEGILGLSEWRSESWYLSRNGHTDDLAEAGVVDSVEAGNLARRHVTPSFRHHANTSLGIWRLEGIDIMDKRGLWSHFKISDHAVTLSKENDKNLTSMFAMRPSARRETTS